MTDDQAIARTGLAKRFSVLNFPFNFPELPGPELACLDSSGDADE
jgi:hypothetical protein